MAEDRQGPSFREIADLVGEALLVLAARADGRLLVTYCNGALLHLTGLRDVDVLGQSLRILRAPETDPFDLARIARAASRRTPIELSLIIRGAQRAVTVEARGRPLAGDDAAYLLCLQDVTSAREAAETLARSPTGCRSSASSPRIASTISVSDRIAASSWNGRQERSIG